MPKQSTKEIQSAVQKLGERLGFNLQKGFYCWLKELATVLGGDDVIFPMLYGISGKIIDDIFVPLIGIELERSINKHCNGGIINMHHYTHTGILISNIDAELHINFMRRQLGINNVTHLSIGELK